MWDHVTLRAADLDASARFYDTVLGTLGLERTHTADWLVEWDQFSLSPANAHKPTTRGLHIGFTAPTGEHVHAFWQAGVDAGYRDDGFEAPVATSVALTPAARPSPVSRCHVARSSAKPVTARSSTILDVQGPPDFAALGAVMARYALSMDMDSMPRLIAEHGLDAPPA